MAFKEYLLNAMISDLTLCQHLYEKIPEGSMDKRPLEGMRSTKELLHYIAFIGSASVETYVNGGWAKPENIERMKAVRETTNNIDLANFVAILDEEKKKLTDVLSPLNDDDLLTMETQQPWGTKVTLIEALLNNSLKYLASYRLQLFMYAKMWGAEIVTSNAWRGVDAKPKVVAEAVK